MNNEIISRKKDDRDPFAWRWRRFKIQTSWEFWPVYIFYLPVVFIWLWQSLRSRDLFFFTLTNPGLKTGGFFGESKSSILQHIPDEFKPKTILWEAPVQEEEIEDLFIKSALAFPIIVKPEIGERGWLVARIDSMEELKSHIKAHPIDLILQPFVKLPVEVSIMVYKMPDGSLSEVTSICQKEFLHITGNGQATIKELILSDDRAFLQYNRLKKKLGEQLYYLPLAGEKILLEPIGNHCRGTKFLNMNIEIDAAIHDVMTKLLCSMPGVYYGRFDMKISSWEELRQGRNIQVLEFNGASSDPAHIFDPGYSLMQAYRDISRHWRIMSQIAQQNRKTGKQPVSLKEILSGLIIYFRYKRTNT